MFTAALKLLATQIRGELGGKQYSKVDMWQGAVLTTASMTSTQILSIPGVVSITTSDVVDGARGDLLAALARAALATKHQAVKLDGSGSWTGYLFDYQGRTLLAGRGAKGQSLEMNLDVAGEHKLVANAKNGSYAIDLGVLSPEEHEIVMKELRNTVRPTPVPAQIHDIPSVVATIAPLPVQKDVRAHPKTPAASAATTSHRSTVDGVLMSAAAIAAIALALAVWFLRRVTPIGGRAEKRDEADQPG